MFFIHKPRWQKLNAGWLAENDWKSWYFIARSSSEKLQNISNTKSVEIFCENLFLSIFSVHF